MYVSHVITRLIIGGAQENTVASVLGLHRKPDVKVDLIAGQTDASRPEGTLEPQMKAIPNGLISEPHLVRPIAPWNDLRAYRNLRSRFLATRPDIVHTHSGKAGILGRLAAKAAGVPLIIHSIHGPSFGNFQGALSNRIYLAAERRAGRVTDHFIGVADAMCQQYLDAGIGKRSQYTTIYSGFDLDAFLNSAPSDTLRARYGLAPDDFVLGTIARLVELKGHDALFKALPAWVERQPRLKLLLVGGGPLKEAFERQLSEMGLRDRVVFTGLVPPGEVPSLVGIMDALVHLSLREGLPRALPQAMAAGKPVVALNLDGAPEVCITGKTGFLLEPGDDASLVQAVSDLAGDVALCRRLGDGGRALVIQRFGVQTMVDAIHQCYLRLWEERSRVGS